MKLAYKLAIDLVKSIIKYQDNVQKSLRYNEYEKIVSYSFELVDSIYEESENSLTLLHRIKQRIQILTELQFIKIKYATMLINLIDKIKDELSSYDKTA